MSNVKSGITITKPSGDPWELTYGDLAEIVAKFDIHRSLFLDVQSEMLGEVYDGRSFQKVRKFVIEAMAEERYPTEEGKDVHSVSDNELDLFILALTLRLQAAGELASHPWMQEIAFEAMGHDHILPALADYYCSANLVFSKKLGGLIFDDHLAKQELGHLAASNKGGKH